MYRQREERLDHGSGANNAASGALNVGTTSARSR
jgi:hypothetical protein